MIRDVRNRPVRRIAETMQVRDPRVSSPEAPADVFCRVLGPVSVEIDGAPVALGGPILRRVLAALLSAEATPVSDHRLIEQAWEHRPRDGVNALRLIIWRLRRTLGRTGGTYLRRTSAGYVLAIPPESTDHGVFTGLVESGLSELFYERFDSAARAFGSALALWRGEPWCDLDDSPHPIALRSRLTELRDVAIEERLAAQLACAHTAAAVAGLRAAISAAPYRERRWELLALGLYRSGQQTSALAELRRVRTLLSNDIGIEPGPALRQLEQRLLTQDPELDTAGLPKSATRQ